MNAKSCNTRNYGDYAALRLRKNKANQSQCAKGAKTEPEARLTEYDLKEQSQFAGLCPEIRSTNVEIRNRTKECGMTALIARFAECDLKKQSQFPDSRMNVSASLTIDYENTIDAAPGENKPSQTQLQKHPFGAEGEDV